MKKIEEKILVKLSVEDVAEINALIDRDTAMHGDIDESDYAWNRCPKCGSFFMKDCVFCKTCGQRLRFVDYSTVDVIPL